MEASEDQRLKAYEDGFRRAGLPLFVAERSAARDIFNRAVPLLGLVFGGEMLGALNLDWSPFANLVALAGALGLLLAAIAAVNRSRGRPAVAVPEEVGPLELAGFVLIPAAIPLVFGGQWVSALVTAGANLVLLGLVYAVYGLGLISILRWTLGRLLGQVRASLELFARAVPLLMLFSVVLFLTSEVWQVFAELGLASMAILVGLFVVLGTAFLVARLPREVRDIERGAGVETPDLDRSERFNVGLVMFVSQVLQVVSASLAVGAFFVVIGTLVIDAEVMESWIGQPGDVVAEVNLLGEIPLYLTEELFLVAGAIASFTGLYFAISMLTDDVYRREFLEELTSEMGESFRERAEYLKLRGPIKA